MKKILLTALICAALLSAFCAVAEETPPGQALSERTVDLDLSDFPANISFAQMTQALREPEEYLGKILRLRGRFNYGEQTQRSTVIIGDRSGCCEVSMEFECAEARAYPEEYPALYAEFIVTGRFEAFEREGETLFRLADAELTFEAAD